jgi:hypothetical protein
MSKAENKDIRGYCTDSVLGRIPGHSDILPAYAVGRINLPSTEMSGDPDARWTAQFKRIIRDRS